MGVDRSSDTEQGRKRVIPVKILCHSAPWDVWRTKGNAARLRGRGLPGGGARAVQGSCFRPHGAQPGSLQHPRPSQGRARASRPSRPSVLHSDHNCWTPSLHESLCPGLGLQQDGEEMAVSAPRHSRARADAVYSSTHQQTCTGTRYALGARGLRGKSERDVRFPRVPHLVMETDQEPGWNEESHV